MIPEDVLAVVVSYNDVEKLACCVAALSTQVGHVLIVDNGSEADCLVQLDVLARDSRICVEYLPDNFGIGYALNIGVARARELHCAWVLTMDQDSVVERGMIAAYQAAIAREPEAVSLCPRFAGSYRDSNAALHVVGSAITSGNLVKLSLFDEVGPYDESLFIDSVDFDFSLRVRRAGHAIHCVSAAVMHHQLGEAREVPHFVQRCYSEHSPLRRYYMSRNFLYLAERHLRSFPFFILKLATAHVVELVLVGMYDPKPLTSYKAVLRGVQDYFARRSGPYLERVR